MTIAPLEISKVFNRDRALVLAGIIGIAAIAWWYMALEARAMIATGVCECFGLKMSGPDMTTWGAVELVALFLMWTEMMIAMMTPTAAPVLLTFAMVHRKRLKKVQRNSSLPPHERSHCKNRPYVATGIFLLGYLLIWTLFSLAAASGQWLLHRSALLSPMMVATDQWLGAGILAGAGLFQFSPWKKLCLTHCGSPLGFLLTSWREGKWGALAMGFRHGAYCTGCCWLLMAILFVAGVMNLAWIALISGFVLLEKLAPRKVPIAECAGFLLLGWAAWMVLNAGS